MLIGCQPKSTLSDEERQAYEAEINQWHESRLADVKAPNGWLNLVGLHWLDSGVNTFGGSDKNKIVFPAGKIVPEAGHFVLENQIVTLMARPEANITFNNTPVLEMQLFHPDSAHAPQVASGSLRWSVIKREDKIGIRLRDDESELVKTFTGVERFPIDPAYRTEARFEAGDSTRTIPITNMLGQTTQQRSPGTLVFELFGEEYRLDVLDGADEFFIVMADETTGKETYGGGRFLYVKKPEAGKTVTIDFNKAYNPPCVFTPYATCPLPPRQNKLALRIEAGERTFGEHF